MGNSINLVNQVETLNPFHSVPPLLIILLSIIIVPSYAQIRETATPLVVILTTPTPFVERPVASVTPTFTPTPVGVVLLEVRQEAGNINVRTEPGPEADQLGTIGFGTRHPVYRQFYSWYEIQFELSPNGRGWIYGELVDIVGDQNEIQFIEDFNWATPQGSLSSAPTEVLELSEEELSSTPVVTRQIDVPTVSEDLILDETPIEQGPLPTFTYPPDTIAQVPTRSAVVGEGGNTDVATDKIPPLFPVILLGGMGIVGLLLNSLRR